MKELLAKALIRNRSKLYRRVNIFLGFLTIISVYMISLETVESLAKYKLYFRVFEYFAIACFTIEYLGRVYAKEDKREYIFSFFGIIDLVAIVPSYFGFFNLTFLKSVRVIRVLTFLRTVRITKLARMSKYSNSNSKQAREIQIISIRIYALVLSTVVMLFATLFYLIEGPFNETFKDIPSAALWTTQVVFGSGPDTAGFSYAARLLAIGLQFTGLLLFGLMIHVVGKNLERRLLGSANIVDR